MSHTTRLLRTTALAIITTLSAGLLAVAPATAAPIATPKPAKLAGKWLPRQLTDGLVYNEQFAFNDYGLTVDMGLASLAMGDKPTAKLIRGALRSKVASYTTGADFGSDDVYAGPTAKLAAFVTATGANPKKFGPAAAPVNLIAQLARRTADAAPITGRLEDKSAYGDYANTIGQAFAASALTAAGHREAKASVNFLLKQQCDRGYFRLNFTVDKTANQRCVTGEAASAPDTDTTALVVLNLADSERPKVRKAVKRATRWLVKHQAANGSLGGGVSTEAANSNSTGLAGWALGTVGKCTEARSAARWLKRRQVTGATDPFIAGAKGAIAYDSAALAAAQADGELVVEAVDQWRRASAQAAPALLNLSRKLCSA